MSSLTFTVPGEPKPKGRPRFAKGSGRAYTPAKTRAASETMTSRLLALDLVPEPFACPIRLDVDFVLPVPKSWPKWKRAAALTGAWFAVSKPDVDNLLKLFKDAANGVLWVDDSQVIQATASKCYGEVPCTRVRLATCEQAVRHA